MVAQRRDKRSPNSLFHVKVPLSFLFLISCVLGFFLLFVTKKIFSSWIPTGCWRIPTGTATDMGFVQRTQGSPSCGTEQTRILQYSNTTMSYTAGTLKLEIWDELTVTRVVRHKTCIGCLREGTTLQHPVPPVPHGLS